MCGNAVWTLKMLEIGSQLTHIMSCHVTSYRLHILTYMYTYVHVCAQALYRVQSTIKLFLAIYWSWKYEHVPSDSFPINCTPGLVHVDSPSFRELSLMRSVPLERWRTPPELIIQKGSKMVSTKTSRDVYRDGAPYQVAAWKSHWWKRYRNKEGYTMTF